MRRLAFAVLLLAPAFACAQAPDALVEAVLDATPWDLVEASFVGGMLASSGGGAFPGMDGVFDAGAVRDSVRAEFLADAQPDHLREILAHLQSPGYAAAAERGLANARAMQTPEGMERLMAQIQDPDPKKGTLANETLARRLVDAQDMAGKVPDMMRRMFGAFAEVIPALQAELDATPGGLDAIVGQFDEDTLGEMTDGNVRGTQIGYAGLPEATFREAVEFAESPAGRYYNDVLFEATIDVVVPRMANVMAEMYATMETASGSDDIEIIEVEDGVPPPPPAPEGVEIFEVTEVQPELIGGLEGLQRRVVYPEAARRAGVEGQVVVQFIVDPQGRVIQPVVLRSPDDLLSEAALAAVRGSKFTPGIQRGRPVHVRFAVPITFRLRDPEPEELIEDIELDLTEQAPPPPASDAYEIYEVADVQPELIGGLAGLQTRVIYPDAALRDDIDGMVVIEFVVDERGQVVDPLVVRSPDDRLSEAAIEAVLQSQFIPGQQRGRPVKVRFSLPVVFRIGDE